jgi:DNA repair protein RecO (recombination protein O)
MIQFSRYLGFFPHGECTPGISIFDLKEGLFTQSTPAHPCFLDHMHSGILFEMMHAGFDNYREIAIPGSSTKTLLQALVMYFEIHHTHGNPIRSHAILEEILN